MLFQALNYRHLQAGGLAPTFEAWRGMRLSPTFPSVSPHKGLLQEAFLTYLCLLAPRDHTSHLDPPASTAQAVAGEFLPGPGKKKHRPLRGESDGVEGALEKETAPPWCGGDFSVLKKYLLSVRSTNLLPSVIQIVAAAKETSLSL